jgi:hypothetical protein
MKTLEDHEIRDLRAKLSGRSLGELAKEIGLSELALTKAVAGGDVRDVTASLLRLWLKVNP